MEIGLRDSKRGVLVPVHVVPRASKDEVADVHAAALRVRLRAPPVQGAANTALIALLSKILHVPTRQIEIVSGARSRHKTVAVKGLDRAGVEKRLLGALPNHR
jgi:uncharacterized protein (TIGR00251 family)